MEAIQETTQQEKLKQLIGREGLNTKLTKSIKDKIKIIKDNKTVLK